MNLSWLIQNLQKQNIFQTKILQISQPIPNVESSKFLQEKTGLLRIPPNPFLSHSIRQDITILIIKMLHMKHFSTDHSIIPSSSVLIQDLKLHFHYGFINGGLSMVVCKSYGQKKSKTHSSFIPPTLQILQTSQKSYSTRNLVFHGYFVGLLVLRNIIDHKHHSLSLENTRSNGGKSLQLISSVPQTLFKRNYYI